MPLLEIFKPKPKWLHSDPLVRLDAVRTLPADDQTLLASLARTDADARVRRAAIKRLRDAPVLADLVQQESDAGVRSEAQDALLHLVMGDQDPAAAAAALSGLSDTRLIVAAAKAARLEGVRRAALERITDARSLAVVAREAEDPDQRLAALGRIEDPAQRASVAQGSPHRDVALAALETVRDRGALKAVAGRAKVKAASRRARALLAELDAEPEVLSAADRHSRQAQICHAVEALIHRHDWDEVAIDLAKAEEEWATLGPDHDPELERRLDEARRVLRVALARVEQERAELSKTQAEQTATLATWHALCEEVESLDGSDALDRLADATRRWSELRVDDGDEGVALQKRFDAAVAACQARHAAGLDAAAREARRQELCVEAEGLSEIADPAQARKRWSALERVWREVTSVSTRDELSERWARARAQLVEREAAQREARAREVAENVARLEALCARAEALASQEDAPFRDLSSSLRDVQAALEQMGPLASKQEREAFTARLDTSRRALYPRVQAMRQDEEWKRFANVAVQEGLCREIEALLQLEDLDEAARRLRDIDARWKLAREVPREQGAALWERFRQARDTLWTSVSAHLAAQAAERTENLKKKEALCEQAEALADSTDWARTAEALRKLQEEWKAIGTVPRSKGRSIWQRFRRANDAFFTRHKAQREARSAEWAENLKKKEALCEQAEALSESTAWEETAARLRALQEEWKTIGSVRRSRSDAVWQRFRKAADIFFERYKHRDEIGAEQLQKQRAEVIEQVQALLGAEGGAPEDVVSRALDLHAQWKRLPRAGDEAGRALESQFDTAMAELSQRHADAFAGTDLDPAQIRRRLERLCTRLEAIVAQCQPAADAANATGGDLAERLRNALAANAMGGEAERQARWQAAREEVDEIHGSWQRLGTTMSSVADLESRFKAAHAHFLSLRPSASHGKHRRRSGR